MLHHSFSLNIEKKGKLMCFTKTMKKRLRKGGTRHLKKKGKRKKRRRKSIGITTPIQILQRVSNVKTSITLLACYIFLNALSLSRYNLMTAIDRSKVREW